MYLLNGQLVYGHRPFHLSKKIKQVIDQGLLSDLPHRYHAECVRVCARIFPQYRYRYFFPSAAIFHGAIRHHPRYFIRTRRIADPAYTSAHHVRTRAPFLSYYRARLPIPDATILLPLVPFPHVTHTQLVCSKIKLDSLVRMRHPSAFDSVAITHILRAMHGNRVGHAYSDKRADIIDPLKYKHHRALSQWKSNGNYLRSTLKSTSYATLCATLLSHDILINPSSIGITLLPPQMPKKEYLKFVEISGSIKSE